MTKKQNSSLHVPQRNSHFFLLLFFYPFMPDSGKNPRMEQRLVCHGYFLGFDSRLFIGSVLRLLYPGFLPENCGVANLYFFLSFCSFSCFPWFWVIPCGSWKGSAPKGIAAVILLYLLSPGSPSYLWTSENMED